MFASASAPRLNFPLPIIILAGCIIAAIGFGTRGAFGLFTLPITEDLGLTRQEWGMAMAIQNLAWGLTQPFAGAMADKYGSARVLAFGGLIYAAGVLGMAFSPDILSLTLTTGIITGVGIAVASFGVVMAAFGRVVPAEKRSFVFGIATAASSAGQFIFAPLGQGFISAFGWQMALVWIALILLLIIPLSSALRGRAESVPGEADMKFMQALSRAWGYGSYRLLVIGFFVCGFHLAFIGVHMPAYLVECGLSPEVGSWAIAVIGLFNVAGSLLSGWLGSRLPKQLLLALIYFLRALAIAGFVFLPVTEISAYIFGAVMGLLWLSTVPLTAGLVTLFFGPRYMGMLYGIAFLSHQIGSFFGVWLGGLVYDLTGAYDLMWYLGILLGLASAAVHIPINEIKDKNFAVKTAMQH
ncbi:MULTISPECIES: MFS transporter [unclassified Devosia]|uniref:MFS transporter n=1 Tax=unclassified Devosia TaxID=196773 RepID=UPI00145F98A5|nr:MULTISPECIES: MFS transporter [unclassified Devosia]MBJ6986476.1 MFS transporter [Devosia sp. MC521]QMW61526.1 MFS transporter [Devosia sp. MC521]